YGVIVYQDQVLLIAQALAGYSLGEADIIRKAMGKKIPEVMRRERDRFTTRAQGRGYSEEVARAVFDLIEPFAGYAFNKAHSVSYAMLAYQTAYLKANFPAEYMTAFLNTYADRQDKVSTAVTECARLKLKVLSPTINNSQVHFSLEGEGGIRFGLAAIKNVGEAAVLPFLTARKEGEFKSVEDLCRRADLRGVGRRALESLVKVGALDCLGDRGALLHNLERIQALSQREQRLRESGQSSLFNLWGETVPLPFAGLELEAVPLALNQKLDWEKELLGAYLSDDRLSQLPKNLDSALVTLCGDIDAEMEGQEKVLVGMVISIRQLSTKEGKAFLSAVLEDISGSIEVTVWPKVYQETKELWQEGRILQVKGRIKVRGEAAQLTCSQAAAYAATPEAAAPDSHKRLLLKLSSRDDQMQDSQLIDRLLDVLKGYPGGDEVCLALATDRGIVRVEWPGLSVAYGPEFHHRLASLIGEASISWEEVSLLSSGAAS
ncbi:MAG: OB-fold nucleic acid binding domain-containing protein, partial [Chloroflexota bacterium]